MVGDEPLQAGGLELFPMIHGGDIVLLLVNRILSFIFGCLSNLFLPYCSLQLPDDRLNFLLSLQNGFVSFTDISFVFSYQALRSPGRTFNRSQLSPCPVCVKCCYLPGQRITPAAHLGSTGRKRDGNAAENGKCIFS